VAILTRSGMEKILRRIMESGGMTEDMERDVERLKDDFDEREGILKRYGETYDGEDRDEYDYSERDDINIYTPKEEEKDWKQEYDNLKERYMNRFFGTSDVKDEFDDTMEETKEDVKRDGTIQSFDELLERTEG
jgi:hypothetical protein